MSDSDEDTNFSLDAVFTEPPRPPTPEPTIATYTRSTSSTDDGLDQWSKIDIRLVGSHPLWGHHLWNASRAFATYLDSHPELYRDGSVLELGAGGGLPGIVTVLNGAENAVLTDYPDSSLIDNLRHNVIQNVPKELVEHAHVDGYIWGHKVDPLLRSKSKDFEDPRFDLIIMSDLVFNHSQHDALLNTAEDALKQPNPDTSSEPCLLVFYTHHRPHLAHRDMDFFEKAKIRGWNCEEILTQKFPPMFPEDFGDEEVRSTVHGWRLKRSV
ncbi:hypothetical protein QCA50_013765 [Cerrena zonata]|uniref:Protein N-terminal and lysine N-methyltransferase EFM7 n=1 Tax=Cerrena zonata TaxID=2478898 RepID=A0AAW0FSL7_9APHY